MKYRFFMEKINANFDLRNLGELNLKVTQNYNCSFCKDATIRVSVKDTFGNWVPLAFCMTCKEVHQLERTILGFTSRA